MIVRQLQNSRFGVPNCTPHIITAFRNHQFLSYHKMAAQQNPS